MERVAALTPPQFTQDEMLAYAVFEDLQRRLLWGQLQLLGFTLTAESWQITGRILPLYKSWLDETARVLRAGGHLRLDRKDDSLETLWGRWDQCKNGDFLRANLTNQAELVGATLKALPEILTGKIRVTDILFPNSQMTRVEKIYKHNAKADYFNSVIAQTVVTIIEARLAQGHRTPARILEIGAGAGGTTEIVLATLRPYRDHIEVYTYSDISKAFLLHAERAYGPGNPYLQFQLFNVERPLSEQGIPLGSYDIAIAANVLHATKNMRATLRNAKAALKRNGALLINEITANNLFVHLTFGLTEGWWLAEDPHLRLEGCPAVSIDTWKTLLKDEGFDRVYWPAAIAKDLGQQIIVARSDGLIRQPQPGEPPRHAPVTRKTIKGETPRERPDSAPPAEDMLAGSLRRVIAEHLNINLRVPVEQISYVDSFADYGVDSISGVQLIHQINAVLGINLETTHLYDFSSIDRLADYILSEWRAAVTARLIPPQPAGPETDFGSDGQADPPPPETKATPLQVAEYPGAHQPIAIIGMSGRFAQSEDVNELWRHLSNGDDLIQPVARWPLPEMTPAGSAFCRYGGLLNDIDHFDPMFFNISVTEAAAMDPQQRLFLEEAWKALEDAGYASESMDASRCGVYVGYNGTDYQTLLGDQTPAQAMWGNAGSILSARISYYLNLQGPAITVDTACSSSLVAVHLACQGLWGRETDIALAGGVFAQSTPGFYLLGGRAEMLSPTGKCYTFDARADGFVPGEGAGVVVLKRLSEAMADGDHIYGVIRGAGINQDGTTNGITAPSAVSQERLQRQVYDTFKIHPENIQLVEAHGTGTKLGDPIECRALTQAFRKDTAKTRYCAIGSIKTNLGHTAAAAGIAGLIKILLSLKHRQIPPSLHYETCNPGINLEESPFYVNTRLKNWEVSPGQKRCAAINAFGLSGTNAHLVIEEADEIERRHAERPGYLLALSARGPEQLRQQARRIINHVESAPAIDLGNLCFTLSVGRKHFEYRLACVPRNNGELINILRSWLERGTASQIFTGYCKDGERREQSSLKRYGNQCILHCHKQDIKEHEYLEGLAAVGELFVQGYRLDYENLFSQDSYTRLSLPAYPFAKERYWVGSNHQAMAPAEFQVKAHHPEFRQFNGIGLLLSGDQPNPDRPARTLLAQPSWESPVPTEREGHAAMTMAARHLLLVGDFSAQTLRRLQEALPDTHCRTIAAASGPLADLYEGTVLEVFEKIQSILETKPTRFVLVQVLVNTGGAGAGICLTGLSGLLKTASQENPKLITQCIDLEKVDDPDTLIDLIRINSQDLKHRDIRYRDDRRQVRGFERLAILDEGETAKSPWRDNGVYLITGGLGGLGYIFATAIAQNARNATLILVNRSGMTAFKQAQIDRLKEFGVSADYQQVDIADRREAQRLIAHIQERYGALTGIIHSAGVIEDNFVLKKSREEVRRVLAPKVTGLVNLDEATKDLALDRFICFSAFAGVYGNPGQADYAAANAFMDLYADYRNEMVREGRRQGNTLSIGWPLWAEGGMQMDEAVKTSIARSGLTSLSAPMGLSALYRSLSMKAASAQIVVLHGDVEKLSGLVSGSVSASERSEHPEHPPISGVAHEQLQARTLTQLKGLLASITSISIDRIRGDESLESYGIDSIMITQLNQRLEEIYGEISKTLFYEYGTLTELSRYLVEAYPAGCQQWTGAPEAIIPVGPAANGSASAEDRNPFRLTSKDRDRKLSEAYSNDVIDDPVAIIGLSGRYPQAATLGDFWENLKAGRDCIGELPHDRWPLDGFYDGDAQAALKTGKSYSKWGGFLEGFADFDPLFFGISPREAENIDPQERLFIESCWEVIEDAGYTRDSIQARHRGRVGVYAGITKTGFDLYGPPLWAQGEEVFPHTSFSSAANRVSYLFNFNGPSLPIDTMCSASLTAIHEACEHLKRNECELAIAGGVNLYLHPSNYIVLCAHNMLSADGKCRSFGAGGNGFVPGEGVGTVLLKLLSKAEADGDHIYGIISGTAINHGGKTHGYTVPSPNAQADLIAKALAKAQIDPRAVSYIEAHGTGTELGDPIEVTGLTKAFNQSASERLIQTCAIGSVKSNIGHCESAAGIAGVTKVLLQLKHKQLAPSLHSQSLNLNIDFAKTPFKVQQQLESWSRPTIVIDGVAREYPRIAGISSFGAGGANAHVIIEEYIDREAPPPAFIVDDHHPAIIVLSAQTETQLRIQARNLISSIQNNYRSDNDLPNIAYTLQVGREAMEERLAFAVSSVESLIARLQSFIDNTVPPNEIYRGSAEKYKDSLSIFAASEELREVIGKWVERYHYGTLLELWVKGLDIDWNALYGERKPRRVSLPTYPFARDRYWLPEVKEDRRVGSASLPAPEATALLRYVEEWKPLADADIPAGDRPIQLIHFTEDEQLSSALARLLEGRHDQSRLIRVVKGSQFRRLSSTLYELPAEGEDGFRALWDSLSSAEKHHGAGDWAALYSWGEGLSKIQGLHSLLKTGLRSCLELKRLIITGAALDDLGSCYDLSLIGYERSLGSVAPQLSVTILYGDEEGVRAEQIWQNLWRAGVRRFQGGSSYELGYRETSGAAAARPALRKQGVYLITGGGGGLGKLFAGHLAQAYQARLALVGRSPVDEEKQEQLRRLKTSGAQDAAYYSADVCDRERMREVVAEVKERWGEINGVIHCAGLESRKPLIEKEWEEFRGILSPKVEGTRALDEVTAEVELDFVCYFSSSAAILGDVGGCDYAIGNRYQMAYGAYRERERERGKRRGQTLVMNWPLWREGGMGEVGSEPLEMYLKSSGQRYLERAEGIEAWEDALSREARQEMILVGQPARVERFLSRIYSGRGEENLAPSSRSVNRRNGARSGSGAQGPAPDSATLRRRVVDGLKERIGELLKIKQGQLNEKTNFADFGFDSIGLAQFSRVLTELYGFEVGPSVFFNYSTVEKLSEHLIERHGPELEALYSREGEYEGIENPEPGEAPREAEQRRVAARSGVGAESRRDEPIAIIGMSGRFPGADNVEELWELLSSGRKAITEIPRERWDWKDYFHSPGASENQITANRGGFIRGLEEFDPLFFEISPREAQSMDPRQRLILQEAWRAFEDAGCAGDRVWGSACGVFIGVEEGEYGQVAGSENLATSNHNAILAARISYFLDLKGPNLAINTACSSGLVAVHYACQSLQRGECEMALAGGVNVLTSPLIYVALSQSGMLSVDGECYAFDNRANGLVPGEAVAVVVLKALSKAVADGDLIYGVIKGSGVNYDGKTNGITAPSGLSQKMLIDQIYENCQVNIEDIGYVISHGTGTKLGDPVEVNSLIEMFGKHTDKQAYCALSSTKPNVGHTFAASGMVSLATMLMAFKHRQIPLSVNYERGNEFIDLENSSFYINKETRAWETEEPKKRLGAISAFGMSGTNAHLLIEEYVPIEGDSQALSPTNHSADANVIIPLSAKKIEQLKVCAEYLLGYLAKAKRAGQKTPDLASIAYTLQTGREEMKHRVAFCVRDIDELEDKLREYVDGNLNIASCYRGQAEKHVGANAGLRQIVEKITENSMDDQSLFDLAELWAKGNDFDWNCLYTMRKPRKISLPTYPFRKTKYYPAIEKVSAKREPANTGPESSHVLHPMVHEKLSV